MKYSPEFLAQKAVEMKSPRCPQFDKWQLKAMFKAVDSTLRGAPETGWGIGGGPEDPELKKLVIGGVSYFPMKQVKEMMKKFGYGSFHTHPAPLDADYPKLDRTIPLSISYGDMVQSFLARHQVLCLGGRERKALGGEAVIKCFTIPDREEIDEWNESLWKAYYEFEAATLAYSKSFVEGARQEGPFLIVEHYAKRAAKSDRLGKIVDETEEKFSVMLQEYWARDDDAPCVYKWDLLPPMIGSHPFESREKIVDELEKRAEK